MRQFCLALALLVSSSKAFALGDGAFQTLHTHPQWRALLHVKSEKTDKGVITDKAFFLSPSGHKNPQAELAATLQALKNNPQTQCRFPARVAWLKKQRPNLQKSLPEANCPALKEYLHNLAVKDISLVFAAEKTPSPTSMMGHLFVKIDGEKENFKPSHALSFFASLSVSGGSLLFLPRAMLSGAEGVYMLEPFERRRAMYEEKEGRALTTYSLNLTAEEQDLLVRHFWEMRNTEVSYTLRTHNCASALAAMLAVARPSLASVNYKSFLTPYDLLKKLHDKGAIVAEHMPFFTKKAHALSMELRQGQQNGHDVTSLFFAPAYNDAMALNQAYGKEVASTLFGLEADYHHEKNNFKVNRFTLYESHNIPPSTFAAPVWASAVIIGAQRPVLNNRHSLSPLVDLGWGFSPKVNSRLIPYAFARGAYGRHGAEDVSVGLEFGAYAYLLPTLKLHANWRGDVGTETHGFTEERRGQLAYYFKQNTALIATYEHHQNNRHKAERWHAGLRVHY